MQLTVGQRVYMNHFSNKKPILTKVLEVGENIVCLQIADSLHRAKVSQGDSVVLNTMDGGELVLMEGTAQNRISPHADIYVHIDFQQKIENHRLFERFPVSLYARMLVDEEKKGREPRKGSAVIKNMSLMGLSMISKESAKEGQKMNIEIFIDERAISLTGEVIWRRAENDRWVYGIRSEYPDYVMKNTVKLYLNILKEEQMSF